MQNASNHHSSVPTTQNLFDISDESQVVITNAYRLRESSRQPSRDLSTTDEEDMTRRRPAIMPEKAKVGFHFILASSFDFAYHF